MQKSKLSELNPRVSALCAATCMQAFADPARTAMMRSQKVLEINPRHPLIRSLKERVAAGEEDEEATAAIGHLLFDSALLESGFAPEDAKKFTARVQARGIGVG